MSQSPPAIESDKPAHDLPLHKQTSFRGDVLRLVSGTGIAQLIAILAAPILTRLYAPEAFGVAALFASLAAIIGVVACMRYELSIVLPDNDREAANLLGVSLCFTLLMTLLTVPFVWLGGPYLLQWVKMPELASYLWMLPIAVLMHGLFNALNYWNTRTKHFTRLSIARVTNVFSGTSATLGAGFAGYATGGVMIAANVGGQTVTTAVLGGQIWRDNGKFLMHHINCREMWIGLKRYRKFPLFSSWSALMNTASWQLPVLMLGAFFGPVVAGFYALGLRILQMPMNLVGGAIGQVFFQRAAEARAKNMLGSLVGELFDRLIMIGLFPMLMLTIIGRDLYVVVFGENWAEAGVYTQILGLWALVWFISSPLSSVYAVLEMQHREPVIQWLIFSTRVSAIIIGGYLGNAILAIVLLSIAGLISYGYLVAVVLESCDVKFVDLIKKNLYFFGLTIFCIIPVGVLKFLDFSELFIVSFSGGLSVFYFLFNIIQNNYCWILLNRSDKMTIYMEKI